MSAELSDLTPDFRPKVDALLAACANGGVKMQPTATLRDPFEQARLWRQSRSSQKVHAKINELKDQGLDFIAFCLESVGPQPNGPWETNAIPGLSWHQWGEAVDCVWIVNGHANWSTEDLVNGVNGYHFYADKASSLGLRALGPGQHGDWPHVQLRPENGPQNIFSMDEINEQMKQRFGQ